MLSFKQVFLHMWRNWLIYFAHFNFTCFLLPWHLWFIYWLTHVFSVLTCLTHYLTSKLHIQSIRSGVKNTINSYTRRRPRDNEWHFVFILKDEFQIKIWKKVERKKRKLTLKTYFSVFDSFKKMLTSLFKKTKQ